MKPVLRVVALVTTLAMSYSMTTSASATTTGAVQSPAKPYDINGDNHADVVIGAPRENLGSDVNAGMIQVLYGRATGVTTAGDQAIHQDTYGVPGSAENDDLFGWTNTSGDFNSDGFADVAVSTVLEDIGTTSNAGMVQVFYGSATGLRTSGVSSLTVRRSWNGLGFGLAAGDFNGDGRDDLAAGGPGGGSGSVFVFNGTASGLSTAYQEFHQGSANVPGSPGAEDSFGVELAAGDINGDGVSDLAIGAGDDSEDLGWPIGSVTLLYGSASGLNGTGGAQRFSKETPDVPGDGGRVESEIDDNPDGFGSELTLADFNADSKDDLAVGAPGAPVTIDGVRRADAGTVTVLYSDGAAISTANAVEITRATAGIPGDPHSSDFLGLAVAGGDTNGDGVAELAICTLRDGSVTVIPGGSGGLVYGSAVAWTQDSPGIPGVDESQDAWGQSLRLQDIKGTGRMSLVVGAPGEDLSQGAFTVIHSISSGLTGTGAQRFSQDSYGVAGTAERYDNFGAIN